MRGARPSPAVVLILALGALLLAGCGGGDGDGSEADGEKLSADDYSARVDEICASARQEVADLRADPPATPDAAADFTGRLIEITEDEVAAIRELEPPEEARAAIERYLNAREETLDPLRRGRQAAEREDATAYSEAQAEVAKGQVRRTRLAREAGLSECSHPLRGAGNEGDE